MDLRDEIASLWEFWLFSWAQAFDQLRDWLEDGHPPSTLFRPLALSLWTKIVRNLRAPGCAISFSLAGVSPGGNEMTLGGRLGEVKGAG